jgi:uncharacterized membrane protein
MRGSSVQMMCWSMALVWCSYSTIHLQLVDGFAPSPSINHAAKVTKINVNDSLTSTKRIQNNFRGEYYTSLELSPSGIDEWPNISQAAVFVGIYASLATATIPTTKLIENVSKSMGMERWRLNVIDATLPILLGLFYLIAGVGHFVISESFTSIYPPIGTWGLWYVPGSAEFHVAWTGVMELLGGLGLMTSAVRDIMGIEEDGLINFIKPISASVLFVLTILVTPANIYMFTHGAVMGDMESLDVSFHIVRFGLQVLLLSLLFTLARDSFFFAWGEELD